MKPGWEIGPFGDAVVLEYGKPLPPHERDPYGKYPVYGANGIKDRSDRFYENGPSIVIGRKGSAGEITTVDGPFWPLDVTYFVRLKRDDVDLRFVDYWLRSASLPKLANGVKPGINRNEVYALSFARPPLDEQRRIVALLDEALDGLARARAHAEANLQNALELFESIVNAVFTDSGWPRRELQELTHEDCSLSYGIVQPGDDIGGGLPIVRPSDLTSKMVDLSGLKRIDPSRAESYERTTLVGGELLLCVRGTTGTVSFAAAELAGANVTRGIVPIRFDPRKIDRRFGYHQFRSNHVQRQVAAGTYGAALMQINIRDLRKLKLFSPTIPEQVKAVGRIEAISESHTHLERACTVKIADLDALRQSILAKAFRGELT